MDDSNLALLFHRREDHATQMQVFCCGQYDRCEVYQLLMKKYD